MMGMRTRGVSYMSGVHEPDEVARIMRTIRHDLSCTSVMVVDSDVDSLVEAAAIALAEGLDVVVRPHPGNVRARALLDHLRTAAVAAEGLRASAPGKVSLIVGNELSMTTPGIVPGLGELSRLMVILRARSLLRRRISRRVNQLLVRAAEVARGHFGGPIGYCAAMWEEVDHGPFDFVGVNLYRTGTDAAGYRRRVADLVASAGKPVVITEFGCGAQVGGDVRGPGSFLVVNWLVDPPRIKGGVERDESVQAAYLAELVDVYDDVGVDGCFAFTFCMADFPHRPEDPAHDLDLAGFGLVAVPPDDVANWRPKEAFHALARAYAALA